MNEFIELTEKDFKKMINWRKDINGSWAMWIEYGGRNISYSGQPGHSKRVVTREILPLFLEYVNEIRKADFDKKSTECKK